MDCQGNAQTISPLRCEAACGATDPLCDDHVVGEECGSGSETCDLLCECGGGSTCDPDENYADESNQDCIDLELDIDYCCSDLACHECCINDLPSGKSSQCTNPNLPYCDTDNSIPEDNYVCVGCLTNQNCIDDFVPPNPCDSTPYPNRVPECDSPLGAENFADPTYMCSVCGECDVNSDCIPAACCDEDTTGPFLWPSSDGGCWMTGIWVHDNSWLCY